jgi:7,8-dihydroneopterin aldolase/epimerase/oxygenase
MMTVLLKEVLLHGLHGVHPGEPLVGGDFLIDLEVAYDDNGVSFESLGETINYVSLLDIVKTRMSVPTPLLERVAKLILDDILLAYPFIKSSKISINKLQAPIPQFQGKVGVCLNRVY